MRRALKGGGCLLNLEARHQASRKRGFRSEANKASGRFLGVRWGHVGVRVHPALLQGWGMYPRVSASGIENKLSRFHFCVDFLSFCGLADRAALGCSSRDG